MEIILGSGRDHDEWSTRNRALAETLNLIEASTCEGCGQPVTESYDSDRDGWYEVIEVTCVACAAKEQHQKDTKEPEPGVKLRVDALPGYTARQP